MAKTKAQMVAALIRGFEARGMTVIKGPVAIRNAQGEVVLIAENIVRPSAQMRLPLDVDDAAARPAERS